MLVVSLFPTLVVIFSLIPIPVIVLNPRKPILYTNEFRECRKNSQHEKTSTKRNTKKIWILDRYRSESRLWGRIRRSGASKSWSPDLSIIPSGLLQKSIPHEPGNCARIYIYKNKFARNFPVHFSHFLPFGFVLTSLHPRYLRVGDFVHGLLRDGWGGFMRLARGAINGLHPQVTLRLIVRGEYHTVALLHQVEEVLSAFSDVWKMQCETNTAIRTFFPDSFSEILPFFHSKLFRILFQEFLRIFFRLFAFYDLPDYNLRILFSNCSTISSSILFDRTISFLLLKKRLPTILFQTQEITFLRFIGRFERPEKRPKRTRHLHENAINCHLTTGVDCPVRIPPSDWPRANRRAVSGQSALPTLAGTWVRRDHPPAGSQ